MINWHKKLLNNIENKFHISHYGMLWIAFIEGLLVGLLIYHFLVR